MAEILVLEDDRASREALVSMLCAISGHVAVKEAESLAEARLLLNGTTTFDLFLLDVNLNICQAEDASGLVFAEEVRRIAEYEFTPIVMLTSVASLEMDAYRKVHCYQYILKPYEAGEVEAVTRKVLAHARAEEKPYIVVKKDGINYKIFCEDIVFIRAIPRGVCICMRQEQMNVPYLSIRQLLDRLPKQEFFQCHRMYVINKNYVIYYDMVNQMIQAEGYEEKIDIGVTYKGEVRRLLNG